MKPSPVPWVVWGYLEREASDPGAFGPSKARVLSASSLTLFVMSSESAWSSAWRWATEWRETTGFWVAEGVAGLASGLLAFLATGNFGWAGLALGLGALLVFLGGLVWRVGTISSERRRTFQQAVRILAERQGESPPVVVQETASPSQKQQNMERFRTYVTNQIKKLEVAKEREDWDEFENLAFRTQRGVESFDRDWATTWR